MSRIGEKLILWLTKYNTKAYKDQMGIWHPAYLINDEVNVTIVEEKQVPGVYEPHKRYSGYRATDEVGNSYTLNWTMLDETSTSHRYWERLGTKNFYEDTSCIFFPRNEEEMQYATVYIREGENQRATPR